MALNREITIVFNEYDNTCSDGCCHNWGIETSVDGVELSAHNTDVPTQVRQILEHLGYQVTIITKYNNEEY